jgi:hypothetical protein
VIEGSGVAPYALSLRSFVQQTRTIWTSTSSGSVKDDVSQSYWVAREFDSGSSCRLHEALQVLIQHVHASIIHNCCVKHPVAPVHEMIIHRNVHKEWFSRDPTKNARVEGLEVHACVFVDRIIQGQQSLQHMPDADAVDNHDSYGRLQNGRKLCRKSIIIIIKAHY